MCVCMCVNGNVTSSDLSDLLKLLELDKYKENFDEQEVKSEVVCTHLVVFESIRLANVFT